MNPKPALLDRLRHPGARLTGSVAISNLIRAASFAAVSLAIAEMSGPETFGAYVVVLAVSRLLGPLTVGGAQWQVQTQLASGRSAASAVWPTILRSVLLILILAPLGALAGILVLPGVSPVSFGLLLVGILLPLAVRAGVVSSQIYAGDGRSVLIGDVSRSFLQMAPIALVLVLGHRSFDSISLAFAVTATFWSAVYVSWAVGYSGVGSAWRAGVFEHWRGALATAWNQSLRSASYSVDQLMLPRLNSLTQTGVYGLAAQFISFGVLAVGSSGEAMQANLYRQWNEGSGSGTLAEAKKQSRRLTIGAVGVAVGVVFAASIASVLLPSVTGEVLMLSLILAGSIPLLALGYPYTQALTATGAHRSRQICEVSSLIVNVALNIALIPRYGAGGAAAATLVSETILAWSSRRTLTRRLGGTST